MDNAELKEAMLAGVPVILKLKEGNEVEYKCVSAIVYRPKNGRVDVSAEVLDKCGRSVVYCDPKRLQRKGGA